MSAAKLPRSGTVTITISYGYDIHAITLSGRTYKRFQNGSVFEMKGQGFPTEDGTEQDFWTFNSIPDARIIYTVDWQSKTVTMLDYTHRSKAYH